MGDGTGISWTDATWNPVRGCSRVSAGCVNCYAEAQAARIVRMGKGKPTAYDGLVRLGGHTMVGKSRDRWTGEVRLVPEQLAWPLRKRKPLRVFVNSMSDLFHEKLANEQIAAVFGVMAACPQHTFQVLTKRARRMREWFEWASGFGPTALYGYAEHAIPTDDDQGRMLGFLRMAKAWPEPLPNVWLGVSVEDQAAADERIPDLLRTPAAMRFLSCEPLIGPVDLHAVQLPSHPSGLRFSALQRHHDDRYGESDTRLDWVIAGCESGPGARPCSVDWLRSLRDQCASAGVAFFLKQAVEDSGMGPDDLCDECGERERWHVHGPNNTSIWCGCTHEGPEDADWHPSIGFGDESKRKPGGVIELPYLDGVQHAAFPGIADA